jgi:Gly-Xaa carboxypeptidase
MAPTPVDYYYDGADEKRVPLGSPAMVPRQSGSTVRRLLRWTIVAAILAQGMLVLYPDTASAMVGAVSHRCSKVIERVRPNERANAAKSLCPQEGALTPSHELYGQITEEIGSKMFRRRAIKWHSGAVQIPTESYDKMKDVGEDPRWDAFQPFHDYLLNAFPLV